MFCPACKSEYRDGFTRCSDCDVPLLAGRDEDAEPSHTAICPNCRAEYDDGRARCSACDCKLVDRLAGETQEPAEAKRVLCKAYSYGAGADICLKLKDAGIVFEVSQKRDLRSRPMQVIWEFAIFVRASEYEDAKRVLKLAVGADEELPPLDEAEIQAAVELQAEDSPSDGDSERSANWDPEKWPQDEATREIWSGNDADVSSMIHMSLRENYIHSRSVRRASREQGIFVLPEDEVRARKIVCEITEGLGPE
jgi:hypothetical protein